jgi:transcriptional regulator with XRE-family HTH domain
MVQHWERDQHAPTIANLAALARVLGVSMDVLFYGEDGAAKVAAERERGGAAPPAEHA